MAESAAASSWPVLPMDDHAWRLLRVAWYLRNICGCMLDWSVESGFVLLVHLPDRPIAVIASMVVEGEPAYVLVHDDGDGTTLAYEAVEAELAAKTVLAYHGVPNHDLDIPAWQRAVRASPG